MGAPLPIRTDIPADELRRLTVRRPTAEWRVGCSPWPTRLTAAGCATCATKPPTSSARSVPSGMPGSRWYAIAFKVQEQRTIIDPTETESGDLEK